MFRVSSPSRILPKTKKETLMPRILITLSLLALISLPLHAADTPMPATASPAPATSPNDPFLWLEDITGDKALAWVHAQNAITSDALEKSPDFSTIRNRLLEILNSKARIPEVVKHGKFLYNFW